MARVLTDNKYYSQIADVIREQNGTSNTYKPQQMVRALKDLFYEEVEGVPPITFQGIGENLLDYRIDGASGGVGDRTRNLFDGRIVNGTLTGTGSVVAYDTSAVSVDKIKVNATTYTIMANGVDRVYIHVYDEQENTVGIPGFKTWLPLPHSFTLPIAGYIRFVLKKSTNDNIVPSDVSDIMLNSGSTTLPYEPYGYKVPVIVEGKNLLQNTATSQTINGVKFTVNGDGSVDYERISTAERDSDLYLIGTLNSTEVTELKPNTNYIFSGGANSKAYMRVVGFGISGGLDVVADNSTRITYNEGKILLRVRVTEIGSGTFYPMIRLASVTDDTYEPYHEPTTTNIYLDEPIEEGESISLSDIEEEIETIEGTNVLTIDTTVQPSNVYIQSRKDNDEIVDLTTILEEEI